MEKNYILALDQGTTSSRAIVFNKQGEIMGLAQQEFPQIYPETGWVEHDPIEILGSQVGVISEALIRAKTNANEIAAIGITNQRETTIVWDRETGNPIYNAIVWQCRRTACYCDELKEKGYAEMIYKKTGLVLDAYFSATKIKWILDNDEGARQKAEAGELMAGTVDTWLIWKLTDGKVFVTDRTNASRTMLCNIHTGEWDPTMLDMLGIPECILPTIKSSSEIYGSFECMGAELTISGIAGDQQSALFGQTCFEPGSSKCTYGTGAFLLMNTGTKPILSKNGLVTTIAWGLDGKVEYALEGSIFVAGAAIQWLRDELGLIDSSADSEYMAKKVPDTNGCYVVPAFTGLGAPYWDAYARGAILGLTRGTNKNHIIRATLDSMAYQTNDVLAAMEADAKIDLGALKVDGGAAANNYLVQTQSDISGVPVLRPRCVETTAMGAAYLAGYAVGYWKTMADIRKNWAVDQNFDPKISTQEREKRVKGWKKAVRCTMDWAKD